MSKIGKLELFTIALGSVIGWGAFILPGSFFLKNAGVLNTAIGFIISVLMIVFIEKSYSVLMTKYNSPGGEYTYARETFGHSVGAYTGWLLILAYISIIPLNATAVPMVFEKVLPFYSKGIHLYSIADFPVYLNDILVSNAFIISFVTVQWKGISVSARMQNITVVCLLVCVLYLLVFTLMNINELTSSNFKSNIGTFDTELIIRIIAFAPWAFIGFDTVAQVTSESKVSPKVASLMALFAVFSGAVVYNSLNLITAFGLSHSDLTSSEWATGDAVLNMMGGTALVIIGLAMLGAVLSGLNGFFISSTRLVGAMLLKESNNVSSNKYIILFVGFIALIVPFFGRNALFWFVDVSSVGASFAYLVTCLAAFKLASNNAQKFISSLGVLSSLAFLIFLLTPVFRSNIPIVSAVVLVLWIIFGFCIDKYRSKI